MHVWSTTDTASRRCAVGVRYCTPCVFCLDCGSLDRGQCYTPVSCHVASCTLRCPKYPTGCSVAAVTNIDQSEVGMPCVHAADMICHFTRVLVAGVCTVFRCISASSVCARLDRFLQYLFLSGAAPGFWKWRGDKFCERSASRNLFWPPLFGQWGTKYCLDSQVSLIRMFAL